MNIVKTAIVGAGLMGKLYGRILRQNPQAQVVAVCDLFPAVQDYAAEIGAQAYPNGDVAAMLADHPEIDAVLVCTPEDQHVDAACLAARSGKHVFIEKPLATSVEDGERILAAVQKAGVLSMLGYCLRFDTRYAGAQAAVARGEIGEIVHIYARRNTPLPLLRRIGGRVSNTFWVGVHDLDIMLWLKNVPVQRVFSRNAGQSVAEFKIDHAITSSLQFADGSLAVLENIWGPVISPGRHDRIEFQINGTLGTIEIHPAETGLGVFKENSVLYPDTLYMPSLHGRLVGVYRDELDHFIHSILTGAQPVATAADGLKAVQVAEAIERSRTTGVEVVLD